MVLLNTNIFDYLDPNGNNQFFKLNRDDLKEILSLINKYYLQLRYQLNIGKDLTFGFEFEFENSDLQQLGILLEEYIRNGWVLKRDGTVPTGGEVNTPILYDGIITWQEVEDVCKILDANAVIGDNCGAHIHAGNQIIKDDTHFVNFIKTWIAFEDIIYRFLYGEYLYNRPQILKYAEPMSKSIITATPTLDSDYILGNVLYGPVSAIHLKGYKFNKFDKDNTLEFRCPNGTLNSIIWENNLNLLINLLTYAKDRYDAKKIKMIINYNMKKYVQYKISNFKLIDMYSYIDLKKALYFCDLIFNNNLDKVYFIRQYLKSFEEERAFKKAKTFTQF